MKKKNSLMIPAEKKSILWGKWLRLFGVLGMFASAVYVAIHSINVPGYECFFLLPASVGVFFACSSALRRHNHRISILMILFYMIVRYAVIPVLIVWLGEYADNFRMPSASSMRWATSLMVYEIFAIWFAVEFFSKRFFAKQRMRPMMLRPEKNMYVSFCVIVAGCLLIIIFPEIKYSYTFIMGGIARAREVSSEGLRLGSGGTGPIIVFFNVARFVLSIFLINLCALFYAKKGRVVWVLLALLALLPNLIFIYGTSRQGILYFGLPALILFPRLFPFHAKLVLYIIVSAVFIIIMVLTLEKNFGYSEGRISQSDNISLDTTFNSYGSSVRNVARALEAKQGFPLFNPQMILFDTTQNIPFIGRMLKAGEREENMVYQYAKWLERRDQILPMIGQGNAHWGFLFAPIYSVLFIVLALYLDKRLMLINDFPMAFIFCLGVVKMVEFPFLLNLTIAALFFTTFWLPLYFFVLLNHRLRIVISR